MATVTRRVVRRAVLGGILLATAALTIWMFAVDIERSAAVASVVGLLVAVAALALDLVGYFREADAARPAIGDLADDLAQTIREEWLSEVSARRLRDPRILPLTWAESSRPVADSAAAVLGGTSAGQRVRLRLDGRLDGNVDEVSRQLADRYQQIPSGRLLILGEPGAGKTVLATLVTLGLLAERQPGGRLPVLLTASTWDSAVDHFDEWLIRVIAGSYYNGQTDIPRRLLTHGLLLPIVDGIDEIPESARRSAVREINSAVGGDRPVVITCRSQEYEDLIRGGAPVLRRAPAVEMRPVSATDLIQYLTSLDWPAGTRWDAVCRRVSTHPDDATALALSTPLMISFARLVYQRLGGDPGELLDLDRFDSRHAVEDYLTDRLIDAAYTPEPGEKLRWKGDDARRWLTFLARYLHRYRERDLAWWLLSQRLLSPWTGPVIGIAAGVLLMVCASTWLAVLDIDNDRRTFVSPNTYLTVGVIAGVVFAVLVLVVWYAGANRPPGRLSASPRGGGNRLRRGFATGVAFTAVPAVPVLAALAVITPILGSWSLGAAGRYMAAVGAAASVAVVVGLGIAVHDYFQAEPSRSAQASPIRFLRQDRLASCVGALVAGAVVGLATFWLLLTGLAVGRVEVQAFTGWSDWPGVPDPGRIVSARRSDLRNLLASNPPPSWASLVGAYAILPAAVCATLLLLTRAWLRFALVRTWLAARRRLPLRLLAFLTDARERQLLRQTAGTYQFRHMRLQERLVSSSPAAGAHPVATGGTTTGPATARMRPRRRIALAAATVTVACLAVVPSVVLPSDTSWRTLAGEYGVGSYNIALSADQTLLATSNPGDRTVWLWEVGTGELRARFSGPERNISDVHFDPGGQTLAAAGETPLGDVIRVMSIEKRRTRCSISGIRGGLGDWAYHPDGGTIIVLGGNDTEASDDDVLQAYAASDCHLAAEFGPDADTLYDDALRSIVTRRAGGIDVWNVPSGVSRHVAGAVDATVSPDGAFIVTSDATHIKIWKAGSAAESSSGPGTGEVVFSPGNQRLAASGPNGEMYVHDVQSGVWTLLRGASGQALQFSADGEFLITESDDLTIHVWEVSSGRERGSTPGFQESIMAVDGRSAVFKVGGETSTPNDDAMQLWSLTPTPRLVTTVRAATDAEFVAGGRLLQTMVGSARERLVDVWSGTTLAEFDFLYSDFLEGAKDDLFVESDDEVVWLWQWSAHPDAPARVERVARLGTWEDVDNAYVRGDGRILAVVRDDQTVELWDIEHRDQRPFKVLAGHGGDIREIVFIGKPGHVLATSSEDGTVRLWEY